MSELKWKWAYFPWLDDQENQHESAVNAGYVKVVLKSEVDKVIAELKKKCEAEKSIGATFSKNGAELARWVEELRKEIESLKASHYAEDDCAYWKMREGNAVNAMHETEEACMFLTKSERHQKYKRCLNKAEWCEERRARYDLLQEHSGFSWRREIDFYFRWYQRWLELAEKFKEAK